MRTPHMTVSMVATATWTTLVHVQGESGQLGGVGVSSASNYHELRVTIDGVVLAQDVLAGANSGAADGNIGLGVALPFDDELTVEVRDPAASVLARYWAAYHTDNSRPVAAVREVETVDGREHVYVRRTYSSDDSDDRGYAVVSLLGPRHLARVVLDADVVRPDESIEGSVVLLEIPLDDEDGAGDEPEPDGGPYRPVTGTIDGAPGRVQATLRGLPVPLLRAFADPESSYRFGLGPIVDDEHPWSRYRQRPLWLRVHADVPGYAGCPADVALV